MRFSKLAAFVSIAMCVALPGSKAIAHSTHAQSGGHAGLGGAIYNSASPFIAASNPNTPDFSATFVSGVGGTSFFVSENKWDPLESTCRHASLSIL